MYNTKTEYRIIPNWTFIADKYLQFKFKGEKENFWGKTDKIEEWRFVPSESIAEVLGYYLTKDICPSSLPWGSEGRFLNCFNEHETFDLIPFTEKYPDIDMYFKHLNDKRAEYLKREENARNQKITYL